MTNFRNCKSMPNMPTSSQLGASIFDHGRTGGNRRRRLITGPRAHTEEVVLQAKASDQWSTTRPRIFVSMKTNCSPI